jgi:ribose-phosphate pyrophosphokinase
MELTLVTGSANPRLGGAIAAALGVDLAEALLERFPDGESHVAVRHNVRGNDVYVVQPTGPPVDEQLLELLMLVDACRRGGAGRITTVIPYFGYARQDRRRVAGEAVGARVVADLIGALQVDRVLVVDPHTPGLEALFGMPVEAVSAVSVIAAALMPLLPADAVVVAPDLGAVKLAERYAALLGLPMVIIRKRRLSGTVVRAQEVVGDVGGRVPVVIDDMISTGATISVATQALLEQGAHPSVLVGATHGLFVGLAAQHLRELPLRRLIVTDSLSLPSGFPVPVQVASIDRLLAEAIRRLHDDEPLDDLTLRP